MRTAIEKARRFGIPLYSLSAVTDRQILSWKRSIRVSLFFYRYENHKIQLIFSASDAISIDANQVGTELNSYCGLRTIFSPANSLLDKQNLLVNRDTRRKVNFGVRFRIDGFVIQEKPVLAIETSGEAYLEELKLEIPEVCAYQESYGNDPKAAIYVQKFNLGETQVVHSGDCMSFTLDLSALDVLPFWQFRYCSLSGDQEMNCEIFEVLSPEKSIMVVKRAQLSIVASIE